MTAKYTVLGNTTLATASSSVTFSSIPGGHKDLVLVMDYKPSVNGDDCQVRYNSDTGSNYSYVVMSGDGSSSYSTSGTDTNVKMSGYSFSYPNTEFNLLTLQVADYSATDKHKSSLARVGRAAGGVTAYAHRWANTSAITTLLVTNGSGSIAAGSTFRLLGVN
tara:strand:- start:29 stop:517 length:489 start_codon:yes stop_codon:yes gene_type:complete